MGCFDAGLSEQASTDAHCACVQAGTKLASRPTSLPTHVALQTRWEGAGGRGGQYQARVLHLCIDTSDACMPPCWFVAVATTACATRAYHLSCPQCTTPKQEGLAFKPFIKTLANTAFAAHAFGAHHVLYPKGRFTTTLNGTHVNGAASPMVDFSRLALFHYVLKCAWRSTLRARSAAFSRCCCAELTSSDVPLPGLACVEALAAETTCTRDACSSSVALLPAASSACPPPMQVSCRIRREEGSRRRHGPAQDRQDVERHQRTVRLPCHRRRAVHASVDIKSTGGQHRCHGNADLRACVLVMLPAPPTGAAPARAKLCLNHDATLLMPLQCKRNLPWRCACVVALARRGTQPDTQPDSPGHCCGSCGSCGSSSGTGRCSSGSTAPTACACTCVRPLARKPPSDRVVDAWL